MSQIMGPDQPTDGAAFQDVVDSMFDVPEEPNNDTPDNDADQPGESD